MSGGRAWATTLLAGKQAVTVCGGEWRQGLGHDAAGWEAGRDRLRR
ncbi:hypothetical protein OWR29_10890 [Actinoplanes sp. Pm04-4]|uniref:Uncharacterized protein n=1 Tax=Paractinoplanes pyxinae TaxID=2997416 RepID=A0ABT4AW94_9ACTN|nr:hypothetical protein [Actinoplanes pyxinae]MCY1138504.1 hypothetical protein [Actinoplanes pyxinae]